MLVEQKPTPLGRCMDITHFESNQNGGRAYNFYAEGTAQSYFRGAVTVSATDGDTSPGYDGTSLGIAFNPDSTVYVSTPSRPAVRLNRTDAGFITEYRLNGTNGSTKAGGVEVLTQTTCAYRTTSDYRLKQNIQELTERLKF